MGVGPMGSYVAKMQLGLVETTFLQEKRPICV